MVAPQPVVTPKWDTVKVLKFKNNMVWYPKYPVNYYSLSIKSYIYYYIYFNGILYARIFYIIQNAVFWGSKGYVFCNLLNLWGFSRNPCGYQKPKVTAKMANFFQFLKSGLVVLAGFFTKRSNFPKKGDLC